MQIISSLLALVAVPLALASPVESQKRDGCVHNTDWDFYYYCGSYNGFPAVVSLTMLKQKKRFLVWTNE